MKPLKRSHVFYLTFMNYSILNLILLPELIQSAGRDLWLSTILSAFIGLAIAFFMWNAERKYPGLSLSDVLKRKGGPLLRILISAIIVLYLVIICVFTTVAFNEFIGIGFLQETPIWAIAFVFALAVAYSLRKGLQPIANLAGLLTFSTVITGLSMSMAVTPFRNFENFLPIGEFGIKPLLMGVIWYIPIWTELFLLALLPKENSGSKPWLYTYIWIVVVNTLIFLGHVEGPISVFGLYQAKNQNFPELSTTKVVSLTYFSRFDIYGLTLMIFGTFVRVSLYLYLAVIQARRILFDSKKKLSIITSAIAGVLLAISSSVLFVNSTFFKLLVLPYTILSIGMLALLILIYLILYRKKLNQKSTSP